jgi:hypothetical protein
MNIFQCPSGGSGKYCCKNGANNPDCCENGGKGEFDAEVLNKMSTLLTPIL